MPNIIKSGRMPETGYLKVSLKKNHPVAQQPAEGEAVPAKEAAARAAAEKIIAGAESEARQLLEEARRQAEEARQQAYRQGLAEAEEKAAQILEEAAGVMNSIRHLREEMLRQVEPQVVELATKIAEGLINTSLLIDKEIIAGIVAEAISLLATEEKILVRVNPQDLAACKADKEYFHQLIMDKTTLEFIPSRQVARGNCIAQGQYTVVDALLQERFSTLQKELMKEAKDAVASND